MKVPVVLELRGFVLGVFRSARLCDLLWAGIRDLANPRGQARSPTPKASESPSKSRRELSVGKLQAWLNASGQTPRKQAG
jgi:hypothetical protein